MSVLRLKRFVGFWGRVVVPSPLPGSVPIHIDTPSVRAHGEETATNVRDVEQALFVKEKKRSFFYRYVVDEVILR